MPVVKIILQALFGILILIAAFMALRLFTAWFLHIENILAQNAETNDQLKEIGDAVRRLGPPRKGFSRREYSVFGVQYSVKMACAAPVPRSSRRFFPARPRSWA